MLQMRVQATLSLAMRGSVPCAFSAAHSSQGWFPTCTKLTFDKTKKPAGVAASLLDRGRVGGGPGALPLPPW